MGKQNDSGDKYRVKSTDPGFGGGGWTSRQCHGHDDAERKAAEWRESGHRNVRVEREGC